jgi:branched-subunit amino acid transport protein
MNSLLLETLAIGAGTYLVRAVSLSWGSRVNWPQWMRRWLSFVTPAVLGALLGPLLFLPNNQPLAPWHNPTLWAAVPTVLVAWWTRHLLWTVAAGVIAYAAASAV